MPKKVAAVAVAGTAGVKEKELSSTFLGDIGDEPASLPIVDIIPTVEERRALRRGFEQVGERGHRAIMQIRSAQPDPIERHCHIPVRFSKTGKLPLIPL